MAGRTLLIERSPGETRAALLDDEGVVQVDHYRDHEPPLDGAVFHGRVRRVEPGINAAFVDLDGRRDGFLRARNIAGRPRGAAIAALVHEGEALLVRVRGEPPEDGDKLARLATLAAGEVSRLGATEALPVAPAWVDAGGSVLSRILAEHSGAASQIVFSDGTMLREARSWFAARDPNAELEYRAGGLFEPFGVEAAIAASLERTAPLPGGGSLIFEPGETLCAIDVNSADHEGRAGRAARDVNIAAAAEIARQLRLREIAGAIVVDFLDLDRAADRDGLLDALRAALADDPASCQVLGFTRLGMVELSRQRRRPSLAARLLQPVSAPAPRADAAACALLREIAAHTRRGAGRLAVRTAPAIVVLLEGAMAEALAESAAWSNARIDLSLDPSLPFGQYVLDVSGPRG
jgi:ribonuclease G